MEYSKVLFSSGNRRWDLFSHT